MTSPAICSQFAGRGVRRFDARAALQLEAGQVLLVFGQIAKRRSPRRSPDVPRTM